MEARAGIIIKNRFMSFEFEKITCVSLGCRLKPDRRPGVLWTATYQRCFFHMLSYQLLGPIADVGAPLFKSCLKTCSVAS